MDTIEAILGSLVETAQREALERALVVISDTCVDPKRREHFVMMGAFALGAQRDAVMQAVSALLPPPPKTVEPLSV